MSNVTVVCIKDLIANTFGPLLCTRSTAEAVRMFTAEVNHVDTKNLLWAHPQDFVLYLFGTFDQIMGSLNLLDEPTIIVRGRDVTKHSSNIPATAPQSVDAQAFDKSK